MPYTPKSNFRESLSLLPIPDATESEAGVMSPSDKAALASLIAHGAGATPFNTTVPPASLITTGVTATDTDSTLTLTGTANIVLISTNVLAMTEDGSDWAAWQLLFLITQANGVSAQIQAPALPASPDLNGGATSATWWVTGVTSADGLTFIIRVKGAANTTIKWTLRSAALVLSAPF